MSNPVTRSPNRGRKLCLPPIPPLTTAGPKSHLHPSHLPTKPSNLDSHQHTTIYQAPRSPYLQSELTMSKTGSNSSMSPHLSGCLSLPQYHPPPGCANNLPPHPLLPSLPLSPPLPSTSSSKHHKPWTPNLQSLKEGRRSLSERRTQCYLRLRQRKL